MRSTRLFAAMARLALAAMLLLCLAPSASRLLAAPAVGAGWAQLCTMSGLKSVWLDGVPQPAGSQPAGGDCAWCPLLATMSAAVVVAVWLLRERCAAIVLPICIAARVPRRRPGRLGARGPPLAV
jgi:hypothetical protein